MNPLRSIVEEHLSTVGRPLAAALPHDIGISEVFWRHRDSPLDESEQSWCEREWELVVVNDTYRDAGPKASYERILTAFRDADLRIDSASIRSLPPGHLDLDRYRRGETVDLAYDPRGPLCQNCGYERGTHQCLGGR